jgi:hypothetical protein
MSAPQHTDGIGARVADAVERYRESADMSGLLASLSEATEEAGADELAAAAEPFKDVPEVAGPLYERIVAKRPHDARALVILANAYWLSGRGPDVVGELAARALAADPANRAAWHLWSLSEPRIRERVERWRQVVERFPEDELARAALADNAASLAGAEHDPVALKLAIATFESLESTARHPVQREAVAAALRTLRGWRL